MYFQDRLLDCAYVSDMIEVSYMMEVSNFDQTMIVNIILS